MLLDGFPGEDKVMVFIIKSRGVWRREQRGAGWGGSAGPPPLCPCPWGDVARLGGLVASQRALCQALGHRHC